MKLNGSLLVGLLFWTGMLHAQTDFRPGFIITVKGDTLYGQIDYRGDLLMSQICKFKTTDNAVREFKPTDIYGYRFTDSKYFVSKEVDGKKVFLEYLIKGKVNVYYMRDDIGDHYYIDKENMKLIELPYEEGIKVVNGTQMYYQTKKHYGILTYYMRDAQAIQPQIQSIKEPEHQNLIKLAENYNNILCKDTQCIIYEKKRQVIKVLIEPYVGLAKYQQINGRLNEVGGFLYLSIPRANERLYLKTGFTYDFAPANDSLRVYKIPLQLQYMYTTHRIQPKISAGINLQTSGGLFHTFSLNAGIDYKITNKLALTSAFNTDNVPIGLIVLAENQFNVSYSIIVGLRIDIR